MPVLRHAGTQEAADQVAEEAREDVMPAFNHAFGDGEGERVFDVLVEAYLNKHAYRGHLEEA